MSFDASPLFVNVSSTPCSNCFSRSPINSSKCARVSLISTSISGMSSTASSRRRQRRFEILDRLKHRVAQVLLDQFAQTPEFVRAGTAAFDTVHHRRGVFVLIEQIGHRPVQQQVFVVLERKPRFDLFFVETAPPPDFAFAERRKQQRPEQPLIDVIAAERNAVRRDHVEVVTHRAQDAEVERAAPEIDRQHAPPGHVRDARPDNSPPPRPAPDRTRAP